MVVVGGAIDKGEAVTKTLVVESSLELEDEGLSREELNPLSAPLLLCSGEFCIKHKHSYIQLNKQCQLIQHASILTSKP